MILIRRVEIASIGSPNNKIHVLNPEDSKPICGTRYGNLGGQLFGDRSISIASLKLNMWFSPYPYCSKCRKKLMKK